METCLIIYYFGTTPSNSQGLLWVLCFWVAPSTFDAIYTAWASKWVRRMFLFSWQLFTIIKIWKKTQMPKIRWLDKETMIDIHNGTLLSYNKNEVMKFAARWMNLRMSCWLKLVRRRETDTMFSLIYGIWRNRIDE